MIDSEGDDLSPFLHKMISNKRGQVATPPVAHSTRGSVLEKESKPTNSVEDLGDRTWGDLV